MPGLAGLRIHDAGPERVERIRARCVEALAAQRRSERPLLSRLVEWRRWLEPSVALGLIALYLVAAFSSSLALFTAGVAR